MLEFDNMWWESTALSQIEKIWRYDSLIKAETLNEKTSESLSKVLLVCDSVKLGEKRMPFNIRTNLDRIDEQHSTFYVYFIPIVESILWNQPKSLHQHVTFLDEYIHSHFTSELAWAVNIYWKETYDTHYAQHVAIVDYWREKIKNPVYKFFENRELTDALNNLEFVNDILQKVSKAFDVITVHIWEFDMNSFGIYIDPQMPAQEQEEKDNEWTIRSNVYVKYCEENGIPMHPYNNQWKVYETTIFKI